jgi:hypothetical protein
MMTEETRQRPRPDRSSRAIDQRLREVSELLKLGLSLVRARKIDQLGPAQ